MSEKDDSPSGAGEVDALRWYVWGMVLVSAVAAGVVWFYLEKEREELGRTVVAVRGREQEDGTRKGGALQDLAAKKREIQAMLQAYQRNKEDEARDAPLTWFQARWREKGIPDGAIQPDAWESPPEVSSDGSYVEEKISLKFSTKNPLRREQIAQFLHQIENSSTRLRILEMSLRRAGREETLANDEWSGSCEVAYRYPNLRE